MRKDSLDDTIVAISTPIGEGGIGIVRLSGPKALKIADGIFVSKDGEKPSRYETHTVHYGHVISKTQNSKLKTQKFVDEVLLTVMKAPRTYTREDIVEINCHGGIQAVKEMLETVLASGARIAQPGEFTKRAFLNGRIDLAQAEAVLDVIRAKTEGSLKVAVNQLEGALSGHVEEIRDKIIDIASHIEAAIDFPEEDLDIVKEEALIKKTQMVLEELQGLIDTANEGMVLREGILAIICGKPNVGKSSLMNLLLKRDRVIVSPIPGTTRDAVEEMINLKGLPMRIVDTAGIVRARNTVEKEGVKKSRSYLALADIVLLVLDASKKIDHKDRRIISLVSGKKKVVVINKVDIAKDAVIKDIRRMFGRDEVVEISVERKRNIGLLEKKVVDMIWSGGYDQGEGVIVTNVRHKDLLDKAFGNMLSVSKALKKGASPELTAVDLKEAIFNLGLVVGKSVSDDILDRIFDNFCIGK